VNANVTLLPTGDALITGGTDLIGNATEADGEEVDAGNFVFKPELWHPKSGSTDAYWETLAEDPYHMLRGYHSNAVLMPDGRVLVGSGNVGYAQDPQESWYKVQVFSPPYLFNSSGGPATRIKILGMGTGNLTWGEATPVVTDLLADSLVLIRASSATHAFNAEQRFVPLRRYRDGQTVSEAGGTVYYYTIQIPAIADSVPPGDYLLFAMKNGYAPSIGRWLHINSVKPPYDVGDDVRPGHLVLAIDHTCESNVLNWTHPGDDSLFGASGSVRAYDLRYSESTSL
jgi:large repetitive protein